MDLDIKTYLFQEIFHWSKEPYQISRRIAKVTHLVRIETSLSEPRGFHVLDLPRDEVN